MFKFVAVIIIYMMLLCLYFIFIDTSLSLSMWTCFSISVFTWGQARSKLEGSWYVHFASCFPTVIYEVFMHNNAFWSNSNAFSLIICKVHTKRENSGSWKSGPRKATSGYLFCTTPNKMKLYGYFFMEYMRNIGANKYQRGPTRWT